MSEVQINWVEFERKVEIDLMTFDHPEFQPLDSPFLIHIVEHDDLPKTPRNAT